MNDVPGSQCEEYNSIRNEFHRIIQSRPLWEQLRTIHQAITHAAEVGQQAPAWPEFDPPTEAREV